MAKDPFLLLLHDPLHDHELQTRLLNHAVGDVVQTLDINAVVRKISCGKSSTADDGQILALTQLLNVEPHDLPLVVLWDDHRKRALYFASSMKRLEKDLTELKEAISRPGSTFENVADRIPGSELVGLENPTHHFAPIFKIYAVAPIGMMPSGLVATMDQAKAAWRFAVESVDRLRNRDPESGQHWPWKIPRESLELFSRRELDSVAILEHQQFQNRALLTIAYCRAIESELNTSLVQETRREMGIAMPDYFLQHCPGAQAQFSRDGMTIDMNAKRKSGWHPPGLGQSRIVAHGLNIPTLQTHPALNTIWSEISHIRNLVAHPNDAFGDADYERCRTLVDELLGPVYGTHLVELKKSLRGRSET